MKRLLKHLQELYLSYDILIAVLGIILVVFLALTFLKPGNVFFLITAFSAAGLINITNGLKIVKDKKIRNMGLSYILFGLIIIVVGIMVGKYMNLA